MWRRSGLDISVAVNLSARTLHDPHLPHHIVEMLRERRLKPTCLEVEITESAIMADATLAMEVLRLNEMGVRMYEECKPGKTPRS